VWDRESSAVAEKGKEPIAEQTGGVR